MNTSECRLDWRTCGHCRTRIESASMAYGSCDRVGFFGSLLGKDLCPKAPICVDEEQEV